MLSGTDHPRPGDEGHGQLPWFAFRRPAACGMLLEVSLMAPTVAAPSLDEGAEHPIAGHVHDSATLEPRPTPAE
jgi:hypothetical protein